MYTSCLHNWASVLMDTRVLPQTAAVVPSTRPFRFTATMAMRFAYARKRKEKKNIIVRSIPMQRAYGVQLQYSTLLCSIEDTWQHQQVKVIMSRLLFLEQGVFSKPAQDSISCTSTVLCSECINIMWLSHCFSPTILVSEEISVLDHSFWATHINYNEHHPNFRTAPLRPPRLCPFLGLGRVPMVIVFASPTRPSSAAYSTRLRQPRGMVPKLGTRVPHG